jgi:hypothetical protein
MFDNIHHHEHRTSTSVHVTEKRAPTDESVRLLAEMEAAAQAKVKAAIRVTDTRFECVVHVSNDFMNDQTLLAAVFSLNGHRLEARTHIRNDRTENGIEKLVKEVATVIACEILRGCMTRDLIKGLRP